MEFVGDCILSPNNCDLNTPIDPPLDQKILQEKS